MGLIYLLQHLNNKFVNVVIQINKIRVWGTLDYKLNKC